MIGSLKESMRMRLSKPDVSYIYSGLELKGSVRFNLLSKPADDKNTIVSKEVTTI